MLFNLILLFASGLFFIIFLINKLTGRKVLVKVLFLINITLCNNSAWFYNEGVLGSTTFLFLFAVMGIPFIYRWYQIPVLIFVVLNAALLIVCQYYFPDFLVPYPDYTARFVDVASVFIFSLLVTGVTLFVFNRMYQKEKRIIENQNGLLEKQKIELAEKNQKLQEMTHNREMITGMIIHDLKNPLTTILGLSENMTSEENIKFVHHSGKQMLNLVMNILDVQKFESTQMQINKQKCLLFIVLRNARADIAPLLDEKNLRLEIQGNFNIVVTVDESLIHRVFVNILGNAIKFSALNAKIIINAEDDHPDERVKISITDFGQGIMPDKLSMVFDKFAQINTKNEGSFRSTGLGLAFCKLAIEAHNNRIGVISEPDKFTTFWFTLDKAAANLPGKEPLPAVQSLKSELVMSAGELEYLQPFLETIQGMKYYQTGIIIQTLDKIDDKAGTNIKTWKQEMEKATFTGNEQLFNQLTNIV